MSGGIASFFSRLPSLSSVVNGVVNGATEAGNGMLASAYSGVTLPRDVYRGDVNLNTEQGLGRALDTAGLAMTGGMPIKAPKGALRSGLAGAHADDPFSALEASLATHLETAAPARPQTFVDPAASSWDLYHGTSAARNFDKFEVNRPRQIGVTSAAESEAGALFLSPAAEEAAHYAGSVAAKDPAPRIFRTTVAPGKTDVFDLPHLFQNDPSFVDRMRRTYLADEGDSAMTRGLFDSHIERTLAALTEHETNRGVAHSMGFTDFPRPDVPYAYGAAGAAVQAAKERGLDTAIIRGLSESNGGDQVIALTPNRVQSFYDPSHTLFSGRGGTAVAGAAAQPQQPSLPDALKGRLL